MNNDIQTNSKRSAGVLLPIYSLPSKYGIGSFSAEAKSFIDFLAESGQRYWQVLPVGPAGGADSPYQPLSCFAGSPLMIDPEGLKNDGLITDSDLENYQINLAALTNDSDTSGPYVDYGAVGTAKNILFHKAHAEFSKILSGSSESSESQSGNGNPGNGKSGLLDDYHTFCSENASWLNDYALFMSVKKYLGEMPWPEWPEDIKKRYSNAIEYYTNKLSTSVSFYKFIQFEFFRQCKDVIDYAHEKGILIIGDMPIYAAYDSADCWAHPYYFELDDEFNRINISGCPPDAFAPDGQLWGNPVYRWDVLKNDGYGWWIDRVRQNCKIFDLVRLDHMRGFAGYFAIPAGDKTAVNGKWMPGPGIDLFNAMGEDLTSHFIAEDLGFLTEDVEQLMDETGFPRMKVVQFGFGTDRTSAYLPENFASSNCVVYTGTHDNDTSRAWFEKLGWEERNLFNQVYREMKGSTAEIPDAAGTSDDEPVYIMHSDTAAIDIPDADDNNAAGRLIELAMASKADICIIPIQDYLNYGNEARTNVPGTITENWRWVVSKDALTTELSDYIKSVTEQYVR